MEQPYVTVRLSEMNKTLTVKSSIKKLRKNSIEKKEIQNNHM